MDLKLDYFKELIVVRTRASKERLINIFLKLTKEFRRLLTFFKVFGRCVFLYFLLQSC